MENGKTIAFYGNGYVTEENCKKLLEFWYFSDVLVVLPNFNEGINSAVAETIEEIFGDKVAWENNLVEALIDDRKEGQEVELVVLWPSPEITEPNRAMVDLVRSARKNNIRVRNLCQALDDLTYDQPSGETVAELPPDGPEIKSEPSKIKAGTKSKGTPKKKSEKPTEALDDIIETLDEQIDNLQNTILMLRATKERVIRMHQGAYVHVDVTSPVIETVTLPEEPKKAYIKNGKNYRPRGRGRPRADEEVVFLTDSEAKKLGIPVKE